jgi:hypothetical protein
MANAMFCFPNWVDGSDLVTTYLSGGAWDATQNLDQLAQDNVNSTAISESAAIADTLGEIDLGGVRDCRAFVITNHNISNAGLIKISASDTPAFSGCTIASNASTGASTIAIEAGASGATLTEGEYLTIGLNTTKHRITGTVSIASSATENVDIDPALPEDITAGAEVICRSGDYSSPVYLSDWSLAVSRIYAFGSLPWGHPSFWTGQPTNEERKNGKYPIVRTFNSLLARYWKFEIDDEDNDDGNIWLSRLVVARGVQPTNNISYGETNIGWESNTKVAMANSGRYVFRARRGRRRLPMGMQNLTYSEAFANYFDMQGSLDIHKQFYFIFDPDDTVLMARRSFLATLKTLNPLQFPYFGVNNVALEAVEVI